MATPGTTPIPPRRKPKAEPEKPANGTNGHAVPDELRRLTRWVEEGHSLAKAMHLAPMTVQWVDDTGGVEVDPEKAAKQRHIASMLADYEALRAGPVAWSVADLVAPADPDAFLVSNLIRPGSTVMLAGPPGAAKSWAVSPARPIVRCGPAERSSTVTTSHGR